MQGEVVADVPEELEESVRAWVAAWGEQVAAVQLDAARSRFHDGVVAFGTRAEIVSGLDDLHDQQWSRVWPTIEDFAFEVDELVVLASPDGQQAVAVCPWSSTGIGADGERFDRPGRATIVLRRSSPADDWLGVHTHFSLAPGVPARSHGQRTPTDG